MLDIETVNRACQLVTSGISPSESIEGLVEILVKIAGLEKVRVLIPDNEDTLLIKYHYGLTQEELVRASYKYGEGITGKVALTKNIVVVPDVKDEPRFIGKITDISIFNKTKISYIAIPILLSNHKTGVLAVNRLDAERPVLENDLGTLQVFAAFIKQALDIHDLLIERTNCLQHENRTLRKRLIRDQGDIIGDDPVLLDTLDKARQSAKTDASVLLIGESGTGKERFAGFIHTNSHRSKEPFVALNCAAIPENLIESELFGHEKGAFTGAEKLTLGKFEAANGGTLFLDEIGDLGPEIQAKLLRVLQESEVLRLGSNTPIKVDVRIVAATHKDIQREISKGKFRLDLFYRLNVITLKLPALRDRKDDIVLLLEYFLSLSNQKYKKRCYFSKHAIQALKNYLWPGNIRQLENLVERSVILSDGDELGPEILDNEMLELDESGSIAKSMDSTFPSRPYQSVHKINRESIINAVRSASGNKTQAAKNLGLSSRQLHYRIQKLGIEAEDLDDLCIF